MLEHYKGGLRDATNGFHWDPKIRSPKWERTQSRNSKPLCFSAARGVTAPPILLQVNKHILRWIGTFLRWIGVCMLENLAGILHIIAETLHFWGEMTTFNRGFKWNTSLRWIKVHVFAIFLRKWTSVSNPAKLDTQTLVGDPPYRSKNEYQWKK